MMAEDPNVTVTLNTAQMFVASWVLTSPPAFQASLLNHEQGHYEISMLNAGDIFQELLTISGSAFASAQAGAAAIRAMRTRLFNVQPIHNKYDLDTNHGLNADDADGLGHRAQHRPRHLRAPVAAHGARQCGVVPMTLQSDILSGSPRLELAASGGPSVKKGEHEPDAVKRIQNALLALGFPMPNSFPNGPGRRAGRHLRPGDLQRGDCLPAP